MGGQGLLKDFGLALDKFPLVYFGPDLAVFLILCKRNLALSHVCFVSMPAATRSAWNFSAIYVANESMPPGFQDWPSSILHPSKMRTYKIDGNKTTRHT